MAIKVKISSVSEYVEIIKNYNLDSCISRGENAQYPTLEAAAFRRNSSLDIKEMVDEFQSYIGNTLTEMQNKHFLAFSQHHGLPTNLLDFTYSPLISLYFACLGEPDESGYVYFIKNDRLISITKHLELINSIFLLQFAIAPEELDDLFNGISKLFVTNTNYGIEFLEQIDYMIGGHSCTQPIRDEIQKILKYTEDYQIESLDKLIILMDKCVKKLSGIKQEIPLEDLGSYCHILVQLFVILIFIIRKDGPFNLPFYFTYEPANIATRISNQSSVFIYQLYGINNVRQAINSDFILEIDNKTEILMDLDTLGINEKFIFNDYDHIASYVKQKHLRMSDETEKSLLNLKTIAAEFLNS